MRTVFLAQMAAIDGELSQLAALAQQAIVHATCAALDGELERAESVISADAAIDAGERRIREGVFALVARQQPVAQDARALMAALRICASEEQMGDLAVHIARMARRRHPEAAVPRELRGIVLDMGETAATMAELMQQALSRRDPGAAGDLDDLNDAMRHLHNEMLMIVTSGAWTYGMQAAVDVTHIASHFQRFADHTVSVRQWIGYQATGTPVLHQ